MNKFVSYYKQTSFSGPRKVGLDSDTIVRIITNRLLYAAYQEELSKKENLIYLHEESLKEVPNVLKRDYSWDIKEAEKQLYIFIKDYKIQIIPKNRNNSLLPLMKTECKNKNIVFHPPDSWIIADFKEVGINKVYSGNKHFLEACRLFNIEAVEVPTVDKRISDAFRKLYRK